MPEYTIRTATLDDVPALVAMQLASRRTGYKPIFGDDFVEVAVEDRESDWRRMIAERPAETRHWLLWRGDDLVAEQTLLACCGSAQSIIGSPPDPHEGELWSVNAAPEAMGTDAAWRVVSHAIDDLRSRGYTSVALKCLEANTRARRFYERAGFVAQGTVDAVAMGGKAVRDVVYRRGLA